MQVESRVVEQHKRKFMEFLKTDDNKRYSEKIMEASGPDAKHRFILDINELRTMESDLSARIIRRPREYMVALHEAVIEMRNEDQSVSKTVKNVDLQVGFEGSLGGNSICPRGLTSKFLNTLVEVEGIVTKCSSVHPKLVRSVQYCPTTNKYSTREYRDTTSLDIGIEIREAGGEHMPTGSTFATQDNEGNPLETEHGFCTYKDTQTLILQEMPEKARVGQLPRSVEIILEHDLVDHAKPGDRIKCVGVYRSLPSEQNGMTTGVFKTVLVCNNVKIIGKEIGSVRLTGSDIKNIRELSNQPDVLEILARSLCPSIFGHEFVKKALILQLLSGCERNLPNGTHLRGDINVMMVGDPSTAKSQLLRAVLDIAPLAISTTGRGSSGVGLTAAVTMDSETGEKRLEAGAMVLADRGVVCIDEFDKMGEVDRVAIHEVMEQQTVTIAKAGIHASLNARCSVLAAANPVYGQYNTAKRPQENIGLPDSLLSRFDLLFIVLDQLDSGLDRTISEHIIKSHQFRKVGTIMEPEPLNQVSSLNLDETSDSVVDTPVWQKGGRNADSASSKTGQNGRDVLTKDFLRKYIHYAKSKYIPELTDEAMGVIALRYAEIRAQNNTSRNLPVTARTLETMIRLSSAAAKARLSEKVQGEDVDTAMELMNFVLFHEVGTASETRVGSSTSNASKSVASSSKAKKLEDFSDDKEEDDEVEMEDISASSSDRSSAKYEELLSILSKYGATGQEVVQLDELMTRLKLSRQRYTRNEVTAMLAVMEIDNKVMFEDEQIHII